MLKLDTIQNLRALKDGVIFRAARGLNVPGVVKRAGLQVNGARLSIFNGDGDFNSECDSVTEALDAYAEAASSITVDTLNSLFKLEKAK